MRLAASARGTALLALLLCLVCFGAGITDLPIEDAGLAVVAECSASDAVDYTGEHLSAPAPRFRAFFSSHDARLYRADLARVKRWGS